MKQCIHPILKREKDFSTGIVRVYLQPPFTAFVYISLRSCCSVSISLFERVSGGYSPRVMLMLYLVCASVFLDIKIGREVQVSLNTKNKYNRQMTRRFK